MGLRIGVLALQGAVSEHIDAFRLALEDHGSREKFNRLYKFVVQMKFQPLTGSRFLAVNRQPFPAL